MTITARTVTALAAVGALAGSGSANMIINGSFEFNSGGTTIYNMSNATTTGVLSALEAYGSADEIDLMDFSDIYGDLPTDGAWKLGIHTQANGTNDGFTFDLNAAVVTGQSYTISFMAQLVDDFDPGPGAVQIGISNASGVFGSLAYAGQVTSASWTSFSQSFTAGVGGNFIGVQTDPTQASAWIHVDQFSLEAVPEPGTLVFAGMGAIAFLASRRRRL